MIVQYTQYQPACNSLSTKGKRELRADEYCLYDDKVDRLWSGTKDGIVTTAGMIRPETKADTVSVAGCVWNGGVETGEPQSFHSDDVLVAVVMMHICVLVYNKVFDVSKYKMICTIVRVIEQITIKNCTAKFQLYLVAKTFVNIVDGNFIIIQTI